MNKKTLVIYAARFVKEKPLEPEPNTSYLYDVVIPGYIIAENNDEVSPKAEEDAQRRLKETYATPEKFVRADTFFTYVRDRELEEVCAQVLGIDVRPDVEADGPIS